MPYSCQLQLGTSGKVVTPVGGTRTCRGIARAMSHTSTFTMVQITTRSSLGRRSFGRSTIAEYFARSLGRVISRHRFPMEDMSRLGACADAESVHQVCIRRIPSVSTADSPPEI